MALQYEIINLKIPHFPLTLLMKVIVKETDLILRINYKLKCVLRL